MYCVQYTSLKLMLRFGNLSLISGSPKRSYGSSVSDTTVFQKFRYVQLKLMLFEEAFHIIRRRFSEEACS